MTGPGAGPDLSNRESRRTAMRLLKLLPKSDIIKILNNFSQTDKLQNRGAPDAANYKAMTINNLALKFPQQLRGINLSRIKLDQPRIMATN